MLCSKILDYGIADFLFNYKYFHGKMLPFTKEKNTHIFQFLTLSDKQMRRCIVKVLTMTPARPHNISTQYYSAAPKVYAGYTEHKKTI